MCALRRRRCCRCVSTRSLFDRWLSVNGCRGSKQTSLPHLPHAACMVGVGCAAETALCMHGGPKNTPCYHSQWSRSFPGGAEEASARARSRASRIRLPPKLLTPLGTLAARLQVLRFFARQACKQGGRLRDDELATTSSVGLLASVGSVGPLSAAGDLTCRCGKGRAGPHCLHETAGLATRARGGGTRRLGRGHRRGR